MGGGSTESMIWSDLCSNVELSKDAYVVTKHMEHNDLSADYTTSFNPGKQAEVKDRIKHTTYASFKDNIS